MASKAEAWLKETGATRTFMRLPGTGVSGGQHQAGTCRMGNDPKTSVVNRHCQVHDVDNLFVVDGSVHVTNGGYNPVLTIMAHCATGRRTTSRGSGRAPGSSRDGRQREDVTSCGERLGWKTRLAGGVLAVVVALGAVANAGYYGGSTVSGKYCTRCHQIQAPHDRWAQSVHRDDGLQRVPRQRVQHGHGACTPRTSGTSITR